MLHSLFFCMSASMNCDVTCAIFIFSDNKPEHHAAPKVDTSRWI